MMELMRWGFRLVVLFRRMPSRRGVVIDSSVTNASSLTTTFFLLFVFFHFATVSFVSISTCLIGGHFPS